MSAGTALVARFGDQALAGPLGSLDAYLERVSRIPVLSREEERALAERFRTNGDLQAARALRPRRPPLYPRAASPVSPVRDKPSVRGRRGPPEGRFRGPILWCKLLFQKPKTDGFLGTPGRFSTLRW